MAEKLDDTALADGGLKGVLGFHLRQAHAAMYRDYAATLAPVDLTQKQYAVLALIDANPGVSQTALAKWLGVDRATMMQVIDRLDARGLLSKATSAADRRRHALTLTANGVGVLAQGRALLAVHDQKFRARFSPGDLDALVAALQRIQAG
jgi:DNA-binding MarR family transcriptional regulator